MELQREKEILIDVAMSLSSVLVKACEALY